MGDFSGDSNQGEAVCKRNTRCSIQIKPIQWDVNQHSKLMQTQRKAARLGIIK